MKQKIINEIRKKTKEEWQQLAFDSWTDLRIWIQEHGEQSALIALLLGFGISYFYKIFFFLIAILIIISSSVYLIALSEDEVSTESESDEQ